MSILPRAVYLDTNILDKLSIGGSYPEYLELKNFCEEFSIEILIPEVVAMEWIDHHWKRLERHQSQVKSGVEQINTLTGSQIKATKLKKPAFKLLGEILNKRLRELGIQIIRTPDTISIHSLMTKAAFKRPPFEERGEKGFRDSILLETAKSHMEVEQIDSAILVSDDRIFLHQDIQKELANKPYKLVTYINVEEALKALKKDLDKATKDYIEEEEQKLLKFVKGYQEKIFSYISSETELSEKFITHKGLLRHEPDLGGKLEKILGFVPVEITGAYEGYESLVRPEKPLPKNKKKFTLSVKVDIRVLYSPFIYFNDPRFKVTEIDNYRDVISQAPPRYYGEPVEKIVEREVTVEVILELDKENNYIGLEIERVLAL